MIIISFSKMLFCERGGDVAAVLVDDPVASNITDTTPNSFKEEKR